MTTGMPGLGSKISLISKADIRYEGRLFTVDPEECTIALASVRSFGTEDRDTQFPVPAQNQVYDYILFRGSDIKDIRTMSGVTHPQPLNDPAIMQLSVPPSLGAQQFQQHPILGHMGHPQYGSFLPMGGLSANAAPGLQGGIGRAGSSSGGSKPKFIGGAGSRSTTPASLGSRKSISVDQGTQAGGQNQQRDGNRRQVRPIQPPRGGMPRNKSRERHDSQNRNVENQEHSQYQQNYNRQPNRGRPQNQNNQGNYHQYNRGYNQYNNQRQPPRGRGRPKSGPFRPGAGTPGQTGNKKTTLKFDSEYDFEQANTEFEELRNKLAKVKLQEESATAASGGAIATSAAGTSNSEVNGDAPVETEKKDDSGNETGAGEPEQEEDHEVYYDKTKSFFDKISCEAVERAKGKMQRTDWRQERKLNSETFGVAATRRGSYRGRGGGYRGGYRGGFRGGYNKYPQQQQQQQRRNNDQQSHQQNQQVYTPLTGEEAVAKKREETALMLERDTANQSQQQQEESNVEKFEIIESEPKEIDMLGETGTVLAEEAVEAKKINDDKIKAADPPACVGQ